MSGWPWPAPRPWRWAKQGALVGVSDAYCTFVWDWLLPASQRGSDLTYIRRTIPEFYELGAKSIGGWTSDSWGTVGLGNYVGITESPGEIFGKIMSIPDSLVISYFEFLTTISPSELESKTRALDSGKVNPRDLKSELAETIVGMYQGTQSAVQAREEFDRVFKDRGVPNEVPSFRLEAPEGKLWIVNLLKQAKLTSSGSEGRRLVRQGAVEVDGTRVTDESAEIALEPGREILVKVGKRRFARISALSAGS